MTFNYASYYSNLLDKNLQWNTHQNNKIKKDSNIFNIIHATDFKGNFKLNKKLDDSTATLINNIHMTRRMKRNLAKKGMTQEEAIKYGVEGEFYFYDLNDSDYLLDASIINCNQPPANQPGLWCDWYYNSENNSIQWENSGNFLYYIPWIKYLINNILYPNYRLNGFMTFTLDDEKDSGLIEIINNYVSVYKNGLDNSGSFIFDAHIIHKILSYFDENRNDDIKENRLKYYPHNNIFCGNNDTIEVEI